jgi:hypothetical protein
MNDSAVTPDASRAGAEPSATARARGPLEFFSLRRRLSAATRAAYTPLDEGYRYFELALLALQDAQQLGSSRAGEGSALLLYRNAIRLLVRASLLRQGDLTSLDAPWPMVSSRVGALASWHGATQGAEWAERGVVSEDGETYFAALSVPQRVGALAGLRALAEQLAAPLAKAAFEPRRVRWLRRIRVALALLPLVSLLAWGASAAMKRPNLALHRPVRVTDRDPTWGPDPQQVVDGDRLNLGFHTTFRPNTMLVIDLGTVQPLKRVDVYNRAECCQDRAAPLTLQLSYDGSTYQTVARRTTIFAEWSVALPTATKARFVRLVHESDNYFHLAEVEVY